MEYQYDNCLDPDISDYPFAGGDIGNEQGFSTELPAFGYPAGGLFDTRLEAYVGDAWKIRLNLTVNFGLRHLGGSKAMPFDLLC